MHSKTQAAPPTNPIWPAGASIGRPRNAPPHGPWAAPTGRHPPPLPPWAPPWNSGIGCYQRMPQWDAPISMDAL
eukprot:1107278-Pyramimonas_sp.AAC.1